MVDGRFNKQENLTRPVLGGHKTSRCLHPPTIILKIYIEALTGFGHVYGPDGLNNTPLSEGSVLAVASHAGKAYRMDILRTGEGVSAQVQLTGHLVVTSSPQPPPALCIYFPITFSDFGPSTSLL